VAFKDLVEKFTKPQDERDREQLDEYCHKLGTTRLDEVSPRTQIKVAGEVGLVRIVPRAGAPSLEAVLNDGRGSITAVFFGRRHIAGISSGRRMVLQGVAAERGGRHYLYNPQYRLLPGGDPT